jgi:hypothetical protein
VADEPVASEPVTREEVAQAIGRAVLKQAENLADYADSKAAAAALKDLAETMAWLKFPNQPHG